MKAKISPRQIFYFMAAGMLMSMSGVKAATLVNFTLSLNTSVDGGSSYTNFHASGAGTGSRFVIGFQIKINSVNGQAVSLGPIATFCSEIQEPISTSTYTFEAQTLDKLAAGQAGISGRASAAIPAGGIGALRAARLAYLFDQYYISDQLTAWTQSTASPTLHAFQLAVWELTHDADMNINSTSGAIYVGNQTNTLRNNARALAQSYLNQVSTAGINETYTSTKYKFWALTSTTGNGANGNPGFQDLILATKIGSQAEQVLSPLLPIPEPGVAAFLAVAAFCGLLRRRVSIPRTF